MFKPSLKRKVLQCGSAESPGCSKELPREGAEDASGLAVHMKKRGGPYDWLLLHI